MNMEHANKEKEESEKHEPKTITIIVNEKSVTIQGHKATGMEIKDAAIAQGVAIQRDFNLFKVNPDNNLKQIKDDETIALHDKEKFRAVTTDDNSEAVE